MDEKYRLVFSGEILEGQHKAVVKRRLMELMKLDEARLEKLFSGTPVVVKRGVDRKTAARYQALFKQAGSRLRVQAEQPEQAAAPVDGPAAAARAPAAVGSPAAKQLADIDGPAFTVINSYLPPPAEPAPEIEAPDFAVAEVGADLLEAAEASPVVIPEPDFELAEVGADLLIERAEQAAAEIGPIDFEVADLGADLGINVRMESVAAPDVSHLQLVER